MKKTTRKALISALCFILTLGTICTAGCTNGNPTETTDPGTAQPTDPTDTQPEAPVVDDSVKLASLTVDGCTLAFDAAKTEYEVKIPAGHPRIPKITAAAADAAAKVEVFQGTLAAGETEAVAAAVVTNGDKTAAYTVTMKVDAAQGFVLQFDDRWTFKPSVTLAAGEKLTFKSSDSNILTVAADGTITAKKVSTTPVTVDAMVGSEVRESLKVDRVEKAGLALFLLVGQSNAWGSYDSGETTGAKDSDRPGPGVSYYINANDGGIGAFTDISGGRTGFGPSLGKHWFELTGEKSLLVHTAISGSPIECWLKGGDSYSSKGNGYDNTLIAYRYVMKQYGKADSNYDIIRTGCFWCQGETGQVREWTKSGWNQNNPKIQGSEDYYNKFMTMYGYFQSEMKIDFFSILMVRALKQTVSAESLALGLLTDLIPVRAAQYTINATTDSKLIVASRLTEIARKATDPNPDQPGWGYMGPESVHHTQIGYNAEGVELAENTFKRLSAKFDHKPTELEVLAPNGRTRLADGDTVKVEQGKSCQLAAIVLPVWNTNPQLSFELTEGSDNASIDKFGKVTFKAGAAAGSVAVVKIVADCGLTKTVKVELTAKGSETTAPDTPSTPSGKEITLRWNFNDLTEENGYSDLTLSSRSGAGNYKFENGRIVLGDRNTDFVLAQPFFLAQNFDWSIEWRGWTSNSSAIFGTDYSKNDFIYAAYCTSSWNYPFRMVSSTGTAAMIPYGSYVDKNKEMNTWKIDYKADTKTMTLYYMGPDGTLSEVVGTYTWSGDFTFNITNMFGRYASGSTLVCWIGEMDYINVIARVK